MIVRILLTLAVIAVIFVGYGMSASTPADDARRSAERVIDECKRQMNDTLNSASTREAHRFMCNGLRNDYVKTYGREP